MQVKIYASGLSLRDARILRFLFHRNGGGRYSVIRPIGHTHAVFEAESYAAAGSRIAQCFIAPHWKMRRFADRCMISMHND